uniref:RING-type domain-containing protein n=1 Tax=viral metagenome TaxID=1070528 RepID=A0A6C0BLH1_9ZZZZ
MTKALVDYKNYVYTCPGRKDFEDCEQCLQRLEKLLSLSIARNDEDSKLTCCVCMDAQVNCVAACGHLLCSTCTQSVDKCPVCRKKIDAPDIRPLYFC